MKLGKFELDKIYLGDCKNLLKQLLDKKIDMCITSPPYWGLRDYGIEGIIWDGDESCEHEWQTNSEVKEMFKDSGSGWLIGHEKGKKEAKVISRNEHPEYWEKKEIKTNFCSKCGAWKGQLGLESDFNLYIKHLCDVFDEVKRVLKKEGTLWVNIGDTYNTTQAGNIKPSGFEQRTSASRKAKALYKRTKANLPSKCLIMIPFRFAIEMVNRGWILRNTIIWHKPNCMPTSVKDRFTVDFEYLFFFVKSSTTLYWINSKTYQRVDKQPKGTQGIEGIDWGWKEHLICKGKGCDNKRCIGGKIKNSFWEGKDYYFEQQFEPHTQACIDRVKYPITKFGGDKNNPLGRLGKGKKQGAEQTMVKLNPQGRNKRAVWSITTKGFKEAHFAVFPPNLIETPIKAGSPEFVCKKCGKAREKIIKVEWGKGEGKPYKANRPDGMIFNGRNRPSKKEFTGYTNCGCNVGFEGGVVLDPFIGSGTTGKVAIKQRKHFIGFEINPEYIEMSNRRLENVQVSML